MCSVRGRRDIHMTWGKPRSIRWRRKRRSSSLKFLGIYLEEICFLRSFCRNSDFSMLCVLKKAWLTNWIWLKEIQKIFNASFPFRNVKFYLIHSCHLTEMNMRVISISLCKFTTLIHFKIDIPSFYLQQEIKITFDVVLLVEDGSGMKMLRIWQMGKPKNIKKILSILFKKLCPIWLLST